MDINRRKFLAHVVKSACVLGAVSSVKPAYSFKNDFALFMDFSHLILEEKELSQAFGALCWKYVQHHSNAEHLEAMRTFVYQPALRENMLHSNSSLQSIAYHALRVWYKGDISAINPTPDEIKLAYLNAFKWKAIGIPARGLCVPQWNQTCTM